MELDAKLFDDLHRILDDLGVGCDVEDRMLLRTRVKEGIKALQNQIKDLQQGTEEAEHLDQRYAALMTVMHLVESGSCILPCVCGCEGCLNDRKTVRDAIGDWRKILDGIDQGDTKLLHAEVAKVLTENDKLKERNAILQHYADTTNGMWATDQPTVLDQLSPAVRRDCFTQLEHPLPPEMREEKPDVQSS